MIDLIKLIFYILIIIAAIVFIIWFLITWGNTPVGELPTWLWWLMH